MVIVAGFLVVAPASRAEFLAGCEAVVRQARASRGCLEFAISPDLIEPGRINIFERWESAAALADFRGDGIGDEQSGAILDAAVSDYDVVEQRRLT